MGNWTMGSTIVFPDPIWSNQTTPITFTYNPISFSAVPEEPIMCPYARNSRERRILASIGQRLNERVRRSEKFIGPLEHTREWNHKFFTFISR